MTRNETMGGADIKLLTKAEACRELRLSLSTLNRRIAAGEVPVRREPRSGRHRVYVMLDDDPPGNGIDDADSDGNGAGRGRGADTRAGGAGGSCCKVSLSMSDSAMPDLLTS